MTISVIFFMSFYLIVLSEEKLPYDVTPDKDVLINSDDDELSQALLLIDILKSDYLQLLRQRSVNVTATPMVEQSACAATAGLDNETSRSSIRTTRNESVETSATTVSASVSQDAALNNSVPWNSPMVHAAPLLPWRRSDLATTRVYNYRMPFYHTRRPSQQRPYPRHRPWRRFFPDYYLYDVYPRRFYKNLGTYLPTSTTKKRLATLAPTTTAAIHTTSKTEGPRKSSKITSLAASSKATSTSLRTSKRRPTTRTQQTSKKHTFRKKISKMHMHTKDPVEAEIATELLKEFKSINVTPKTTRAKTPTVDSSSTE